MLSIDASVSFYSIPAPTSYNIVFHLFYHSVQSPAHPWRHIFSLCRWLFGQNRNFSQQKEFSSRKRLRPKIACINYVESKEIRTVCHSAHSNSTISNATHVNTSNENVDKSVAEKNKQKQNEEKNKFGKGFTILICGAITHLQ